MFSAFRLCPPSKMKCVLLGEQPYIEKQYSHPLFFGVPEANTQLPYELEQIMKQ